MLNYDWFWKLVAALYFKGKSRPAGNVSSLSYGTEHEGGTVRAGRGLYFFYAEETKIITWEQVFLHTT